jgi:5-methylcytosine-specific restriction endonuclease McrA
MQDRTSLDVKRQVPFSEKVKIWHYYAHSEGGLLQPVVTCFVCKQFLRPATEVYANLKKCFRQWPALQELEHLPGAEYGHIIPYIHGGPSVRENIRLVCHDCNIRMGDQNLYDFCRQHNRVIVENPNELMVISAETYMTSHVPEMMMTDDLDLSTTRCKAQTKRGVQCQKRAIRELNYCSVHSGTQVLAK